MDGQTSWKHVTFTLVGLAAVLAGALALGAVVDDTGNTFVNAFLGSLGAALILFGVATAVAAITTYLASRR